MRKVDQVKYIEQETFSLEELGYKKNNTNEKQKKTLLHLELVQMVILWLSLLLKFSRFSGHRR